MQLPLSICLLADINGLFFCSQPGLERSTAIDHQFKHSMLLATRLSHPRLTRTLIRYFSSYYDTLGVDHGASQQEIKNSYFDLVKVYHPDSPTGRGDPTRFIQIKEAYETLSDENKRKQYDNSFFRQFHRQQTGSYAHSETRSSYRQPFADWNEGKQF
jgi:DnaJ-domain-containing protein 1